VRGLKKAKCVALWCARSAVDGTDPAERYPVDLAAFRVPAKLDFSQNPVMLDNV